jgi:hypothetical protein
MILEIIINLLKKEWKREKSWNKKYWILTIRKKGKEIIWK